MSNQRELDYHFINEQLRELGRAREKFPSANFSTLALVEEVGELAQAVLKVRAGKWPATRVFDEAIQVAVMAMRVALETDESLTTSYTEPSK